MNNTEKSWEGMYLRIKPLTRKMKAKYPKDCNIEGLEPALTTDIVDIGIELLSSYKESLVARIERMGKSPEATGNIMTDSVMDGYNQALSDIKSLIEGKEV